MALGENIEEILLRIKTEGRTEMDGFVQGLKSLHNAYDQVFKRLAAGEQSGDAAARELRKIANAAAQVTKQIQAFDPEYARMQESLKRMDEETSRSAVEAARMRGQASRTVIDALHSQAEGNRLLAESSREAADAENARYQATLKAMSERGGEERAQKEKENADAVKQGTAAVRDQMQAYDDLAALRRRLGEMNEADRTNEHERLRQAASDNAALAAEEERRAARRKANYSVLATDVQQEIQLRAMQKLGAADLAREEEHLNQVINVGANYADKGRANWAGFTRQHYEHRAAVKEQVATQQKANAEFETAADKQKKFGYAVLNVSHAMQDLQYGVGAVINNIPLLAMAFGKSPQWAGGAMMVGVAFDVLYNNIGKVKDAIVDTSGVHKDHLQEMTEQVDALNKKWFQNRHEVHEAAQAQRDLADATEAARVRAMPTEEATGFKRAFDETVAKLPGGGKGVESVVQDVAVNEFLNDPVRAVRRAIETGRIARREDLGITPERVGATMQDDRMYALLREQWFTDVLPKVVAETTTGLAGGDVNATREFMARARAHPRLGAMDGGEFANPFLRGLQRRNPAELKRQAAEVAALETESRVGGDAYDKAVSDLVTRKAKPLEGELSGRILDMIRGGQDRERIHPLIRAEIRRRLGEVYGAGGAASKIAEQVMEKVFADVMAATDAGMTEEQGAGAVIQGRAEAAAAKADKKKFGDRDPVTGKPMDEFRADQRRRRKELDALTPAGQMREFRAGQQARVVDLANQVGMARPDLNGEQVVAVATEANKLMGMGFDQMSALNQALVNVQMQMMQVLGRQQVTNQTLMGQVNGMRQRLPSLLRAPMPMMPR